MTWTSVGGEKIWVYGWIVEGRANRIYEGLDVGSER